MKTRITRWAVPVVLLGLAGCAQPAAIQTGQLVDVGWSGVVLASAGAPGPEVSRRDEALGVGGAKDLPVVNWARTRMIDHAHTSDGRVHDHVNVTTRTIQIHE